MAIIPATRPSLRLVTAHPIAYSSPDYIVPCGTKNDNNRNGLFCQRLVNHIGKRPVSVLDLGCAGGGMVEDFINAGHVAIGIEGSDYSKNAARAAWATIPDNLFTADATKKFIIYDPDGDGEEYKFDAVTAWEFFEHIAEPDLCAVMDNIRRHTEIGSLLVASISDCRSMRANLEHHQTRKPGAWWLNYFSDHGFIADNGLVISLASDGWVRRVRYNFALVRIE